MGFLIPAALACALLAVPIILFYMLKLRRQPARVSSLLLWQQVVQDRQANAPWQRIRRNLLLLLQLLTLALFVLALARPYLTGPARVQGNIVLLLDASASMQATDVAPSRFGAAQAAARDLVDRLDPDKAVTLISVERTPRVLASISTDRAAIKRLLDQARPTNGPADWQLALTLAVASAAAQPQTTIVLVSDGGWGQGDESGLKLADLPVPVEFFPVGRAAHNQGLTALAMREGTARPELFIRVANADSTGSERRLEIYVDDRLFDSRQLQLPARASTSLTLADIPLSTRHVEARLAGGDDLAVDDRAWAVRGSRRASVLLVSEGNLFLERALALLPDLTVQRAVPGQALPNSAFDLTIFDRTVPAGVAQSAGLPGGSLLFIAPPQSTPLFEVKGSLDQPQVTRVMRDHPLLTYVELNQWHIAQTQVIVPPAWGQTLAAAQANPLLIAGQADGRRVAVLAFALHQSDLPLQLDFPILLVNLTRWLLPGSGPEQGRGLQPGQPFDLPVSPAADTLEVVTPSGQRRPVSLEQASFDETTEPGLYRVFTRAAGTAAPAFLTEFAVNLLAAGETDVQPGLPQSYQPVTAGLDNSLTSRREGWWLLAGLGLAGLVLEWWVYWRGGVR